MTAEQLAWSTNQHSPALSRNGKALISIGGKVRTPCLSLPRAECQDPDVKT
ncbi:hypothetical protein [Deinococcus aquatilis]|uniref:hypothetical protein n=1 Tax=Deinococcus aquatilis TaxID=519440 RepID=UPI0003A7BB2B|nr:hypothetical protein [Deinococcus aquatilis]